MLSLSKHLFPFLFIKGEEPLRQAQGDKRERKKKKGGEKEKKEEIADTSSPHYLQGVSASL